MTTTFRRSLALRSSWPTARLGLLLLLGWASLLRATTYYIDYATGSDSNSGTSKLTPWKHVPAMQPFRGNYTHQHGDRFIFKGGVTWPREAVPLYITVGGTEGHYDYYGVDQTWFTGERWSRPIFTANWQPFINHTSVHRENMIRVYGSASRYIHFDNLHLSGWQITNPVANDSDCAGINVYSSGDLLVTNCYIGDWRPAAAVEGGGGVIGGYNLLGPIVVQDCTIEGPLYIEPQYVLSPGGFTTGVGVRDATVAERCDISRVSNGVWSVGRVNDCIIHDGGNSATYGHENLVRSMGSSMDFYNNICWGWQGVGIYFTPSWGGRSSTQRAWNNVLFNLPQHQISNEQGTGGNTSSVLFANNVVVGTRVAVGYKTSADFGGPVVLVNNLFINDRGESFVFNNSISKLTRSNNVIKTAAEAAACGMVQSNHYQPTSEVWGVTDQGSGNCSRLFAYDVNNILRPQGLSWDIGAYEFTISGPTPSPTPNATPPAALSLDTISVKNLVITGP